VIVLKGLLVSESLRTGAELNVALHVLKIWSVETASATAAQPSTWTLIQFAAPDTEADRLATALADCLSPTGGWYADFGTDAEKFVIFAGKVFRYPQGDPAGQAEAKAYGRSAGVPEAQLDWGD
jgi:hypothetical protein